MKFKDIINKTFGRWTVEKQVSFGNKAKDCTYLCVCNKCGQSAIFKKQIILYHTPTTCSGCKEGYRYRNFDAPKEDLSGKVIGKLKVLYPLRSEKNQRWNWHCRCDCGKETDVDAYKLLTGHTKSCGCSAQKGINNHRWKGFGNVSGHTIALIKHSAKVRNIEFNLSLEYLSGLFEKQHGKCVLTGLPIGFHSARRSKDGTASLDRIDSFKGYIEGNVQWVHKDVNRMKSNFDPEYFYHMCLKVVHNAKATNI